MLLLGRSGAELVLLSGGMTPKGRPLLPLGIAPADPGRKFDLQINVQIKRRHISFKTLKDK